jgi:uncharacterized membrane protein
MKRTSDISQASIPDFLHRARTAVRQTEKDKVETSGCTRSEILAQGSEPFFKLARRKFDEA